LDFNQDKVCEFIVLANGTMVENGTILFPACSELLESLEKLPENLDANHKRIINGKIEEISRTAKNLTRNVDENVPASDKVIAVRTLSSAAQKRTNLDWSLSNPPEHEWYRGKYVAIENARVVGSGRTSGEALAEARKDNPKRGVLLKLVSDVDIGL